MYFSLHEIYNRNLLKTLGKALLIATGVTFGLVKALDCVVEDTLKTNSPVQDNLTNPIREDTARRLDSLEERLEHLEKSIQVINAGQFIGREELDRSITQLTQKLDEDMDRRFEVQSRSVQSLRTMISHTGELLDQVIENIESGSVHA